MRVIELPTERSQLVVAVGCWSSSHTSGGRVAGVIFTIG
jgi:hypothetical protein